MKDNNPLKRTIKGISIYQGEIHELHFSNEKTNETTVMYHYENYGNIDEKNVFKSKEELKSSVFKEIDTVK
ncbi:hypothetical protein [Tenacibaculum maritimum]